MGPGACGAGKGRGRKALLFLPPRRGHGNRHGPGAEEWLLQAPSPRAAGDQVHLSGTRQVVSFLLLSGKDSQRDVSLG